MDITKTLLHIWIPRLEFLSSYWSRIQHIERKILSKSTLNPKLLNLPGTKKKSLRTNYTEMPELLFHLGMPLAFTSVPHHTSIFDIVLIM